MSDSYTKQICDDCKYNYVICPFRKIWDYIKTECKDYIPKKECDEE